MHANNKGMQWGRMEAGREQAATFDRVIRVGLRGAEN